MKRGACPLFSRRITNCFRHQGYSFVELLVVITIIGVLIALLLPAIQAAREAARRAGCMNNLRQLGTALFNYESTHQVLPAGSIEKKGPIRDVPKGYHMGWIVQILPYIEEQITFDQVDFSVGVYDPKNARVRSSPVEILGCPSAEWIASTQALYRVSDYAACHHDVEAPIDVDNHGAFIMNRHLRLVEILDGTSHTLFLGEKPREEGDLGWMSGTRATLRNTDTLINSIGGAFAPGYEPNEDLENGTSLDLFVGGFDADHPGVVNFLFGDGSVRTVWDGISVLTFQQMGHRSDGKLIEEEVDW